MNKVDEIKELVSYLNKASEVYYSGGMPIIDDAEFDEKLEQLKKIESETGIVLSNSPTHRVGYDLTNISYPTKQKKEELDHPMLSLDKVHSPEDIISFLDGKEAYMSVKLDGNSVTARYENGELTGLHSRGNGNVGNDLLIHAKSFTNLPLKIPVSGTFIVDGEAIITYGDFEKINAVQPENYKFANPRNLVAGTLALLDSEISAKRCLKFVAWNVIWADCLSNDFWDNLRTCKEYGFDTVPITEIPANAKEDVLKDKLHTIKEFAKCSDYPMDGAVVTFANVMYGKSLGRTEKFFRHSVAYKYEDEIVFSRINTVEWSVGKTKITPVAHFVPVVIDGTTVTKASLHNVSIFKNLQLGTGDTVSVYKANLIIPQIRENLTKSNTFLIPQTCPVCGGKTEVICKNASEELICTNPDCDAKLLNRIKHFCSRDAINIEGLSEATIQKFIEHGYIGKFKDIFNLKNHYEELILLEGFGEKSIQSLIASIEKSRNTTLANFIYALSIPLVGKTAAKTIESRTASFEWLFSDKGMEFEWQTIEGIGNEIAISLQNFIRENNAEITELAKEFVLTKRNGSQTEKSNVSGKTFCITGNVEHFKNRNELKTKLETMGAKVTASVTSKTDYLINNDINSVSSKNKTAQKLGVEIINEEKLLDLLKI